MATTNPSARITSDPPLDDGDYDEEPTDGDSYPLIGGRDGKISTKKVVAIVVVVLILGAVIGVVVWRVTSGSDCSKLKAPTHGNISCTDTVCNFACNNGYYVIGSKQLTCSKGKWNGTEPLCEAPCPKLSVPSHGNMTCQNSTNNINSSCTFTCGQGYDIIGNSHMECTDGNWSGTPPVCELPCPALHPPSHGNMTCTNATITAHAKCRFVCQTGYKIIGSNARTCRNGKWNGSQPLCQKGCPSLNPPKHGEMSCTNATAYGKVTCNFTCDKGFVLDGSSNETCANGTWGGPPPSCLLRCPVLPEPANGNASCEANDMDTNATCAYTCNKGFTLLGHNKLNCTNGVWNGSPPYCQSGCPALSRPVHGNISCTNGTSDLNETCTFTCDKGYEMVGPKKRDCLNGKWRGNPTLCVSPCPALSPPTHGNMTCENNTLDLNATCKFTCDKGYNMTGPSQVNCTNGIWDAKGPTCRQGCSELKPIDFGNFTCSNGHATSSICNFTCNSNHNINGNQSLTCEASGQWSYPEPKCLCPKCKAGNTCQESISWKDVANILDGIKWIKGKTVHYGGITFSCSIRPNIRFHWSGTCTSGKTTSKCYDYKSRAGAAKHAASDLIRKLAKQGACPMPCDPEGMATGCQQSVSVA